MIQQLLDKLNIKYEDLTADEKRTYQEWDTGLTAPAVTIENLQKFLPIHIDGLEHQQNDYQNTPTKDIYLKAAIRNAKMVLAFITGPEKRREWVKRHLEQRIKQ